MNSSLNILSLIVKSEGYDSCESSSGESSQGAPEEQGGSQLSPLTKRGTYLMKDITFHCLIKTPGLIITPPFLSELFQILKTCLIITPPLVQKILIIIIMFFHLF